MEDINKIIQLAQDNPAVAGWGGLILLFFLRSWLGAIFSKWFWFLIAGLVFYLAKKGFI